MKILVVPEIREKIITDMNMSKIETNIYKIHNKLSVANLMNWSIFAPKVDSKEESTLDTLIRGYFALSEQELFLSIDVYIGFLLREDFPEIDLIIYESEAAKDIVELRFKKDILPEAKEVIIIGEGMSIENEVYKRAVINNYKL